MPLVLENDIHFDPTTNDAVIWGDANHQRFRLVITRKLLMDRFDLKTRFDNTGAQALIREHWTIFEQRAEDAYEAGTTEVRFDSI